MSATSMPKRPWLRPDQCLAPTCIFQRAAPTFFLDSQTPNMIHFKTHHQAKVHDDGPGYSPT